MFRKMNRLALEFLKREDGPTAVSYRPPGSDWLTRPSVRNRGDGDGAMDAGGVAADVIVGDQTWAVSLHAASATLETAVGLQYAT